MKNDFTYLDVNDKPVKLSSAEIEWFQQKVQLAKKVTGCQVEIYACDFDLINHNSYSLGFCFTDCLENPSLSANTYIAIDTYYIHECYQAEVENDFIEILLLNGACINETICHEIAHLKYWNHGERHEALTLKYKTMMEDLENGRHDQEAC